jgi:hypothetical protein
MWDQYQDISEINAFNVGPIIAQMNTLYIGQHCATNISPSDIGAQYWTNLRKNIGATLLCYIGPISGKNGHF